REQYGVSGINPGKAPINSARCKVSAIDQQAKVVTTAAHRHCPGDGARTFEATVDYRTHSTSATARHQSC
ncbi:MAG: hypothetical protein RL254_553, partial [Planctomycetota bacterium]